MHPALQDLVRTCSTTPLSADEQEAIERAFVPRRFRKRQFLHQEGAVCSCVAFIVKGAMREYSVDDKGVEHIVGLAIENGWAGDRESFELQVPAKYFVDAWEDTDALVITWDALKGIIHIPAVQEVRHLVSSTAAIDLLNRVNTAISHTAEERYAELEKQHPEFLQRFPQHVIASYLGMTKETLSRVRGHASKK
jgi:CRP-like cAMP-binding protein